VLMAERAAADGAVERGAVSEAPSARD
jgi:hypothetical protein